MPELICRYPLDGVAIPGTGGSERASGAGVVLSERRGLALCQLMARRGCGTALAAKLSLGDAPGQAVEREGFTALPIAPGQWMLVAAGGRDGAFCRTMSERAGDHGHASDQSHGRAVIRLAGSCANAVLAKGCRLDLHPRVVAPGFCAQTTIAQIGVLMHRVDAAQSWDLIVFCGLAVSFWNWLRHAAAEYGYRVDAADPGLSS